ncbi:hypothetical protein HYW94_00665 [Candidatus Uhrbacteria bacterium]|nr:hypothetical protein [Candidatus Uhrbacteria bacterium]
MKPDSIHALKKKLDGIVEGNGKREEIQTFLEQEKDEDEDGEEETAEIIPPKSNIKKIILGGICLFFFIAAALAWLGYALFNPYNKKESLDGMRVRIDKEDTAIAAGSDVHYRISYENAEKNPVTDIVLIIEYPAGFSLKHTSLTPQNTQKNYWEIGNLNAGEEGSLTIDGAVMGRKDEEKQFFATLYYRPNSMNTQFVVKKSWKLRISSQPILFDGPSEATVGDDVTYTVSYTDLRGIGGGLATLLHIDLPQSFLIREIAPKPDRGTASWTLETLVKNMDQATQSGSLKILGVYKEGTKGTMGIRVSLESPNGETRTSSDLALFQTKVLEGEQQIHEDLSVKLILNNSSSDMPVTLGAPLEYAISIQHMGTIPIQSIRMHMQFKNLASGSAVGEWKSGVIRGTSKEIRENTIEWTSADIPEFSSLNPGENIDVQFQLYLPKKIETADAILEGAAIVSGAKHDPIKKDPLQDTQVLISSNVIKSPVNSDFALSLDSAIPDNELVIGKQKTYRITWTVSNSLHELKELKISGRLPSTVVWLGNETLTAGEIRFDSQTRQILWTLNRLPVSVHQISIAFDVQITPTEDDLKRIDACSERKPLPLLSKIIASATDTVAKSTVQSEQSIVIQGPALKECKNE